MVAKRVIDPHPIDFIVAGGPALGLGHVMRCAALAESALRRGSPVRLFLDGDGSARRAWQAATPGSATSPVWTWSDYPAGPPAPVAFLDCPSPKEAWLATLKQFQSRSIVIDDARYVHLADLTINPGLHHGLHPKAAEAGPRSLEGPAYSILADAHLNTDAQPWSDRQNLLLSIGGADPHRATPKLARWISDVLKSLFGSGTHRCPFAQKHAVLGGAFQDPDGRVRQLLFEDGWHVHQSLSPTEMAAQMAAARLAVTGFGTSLTELAWHGTPHLSVTHHFNDIAPAEALEASGIGRHLGPANELDPLLVKHRLQKSLNDLNWQASSARTARARVRGGRGAQRILDRVDQMLAPERFVPKREKVRPPPL